MQESVRTLIHRFRDTGQTGSLELPGSPFAAGLATTITKIDTAARRIELQFHAGSDYTAGPRGAIQGGAIATMLDFSMVYLLIALTAADKASATANLNLSYLRPAMVGIMRADAHIERLGRTLAFAHASLRTDGGDVVATATGTFSIFDAAATTLASAG